MAAYKVQWPETAVPYRQTPLYPRSGSRLRWNFQDSSIFQGCDEAQAARTLSFERNAMVDIESVFDMDYVNETSKAHLDKRQEELEKQRIKDKKHKATISQRESNRTLIKRFNQHSSLVLRSCQTWVK